MNTTARKNTQQNEKEQERTQSTPHQARSKGATAQQDTHKRKKADQQGQEEADAERIQSRHLHTERNKVDVILAQKVKSNNKIKVIFLCVDVDQHHQTQRHAAYRPAATRNGGAQHRSQEPREVQTTEEKKNKDI